MKKNDYYTSRKFGGKLKLLIIMKLTLLFITLSLLQVNANVFSQNGTFNLSANGAQIKDVLKELEDNSTYRFFYTDNLVYLNNKVKLSIRNSSLEEVLNKLLQESPLTYKIFENNLVVILPINDSEQQHTVKGRVTDIQGNPLPGVNIVEVGTTNGAVTDLDGNFSIALSSPEATLSFSFVGYLTEEISVNGQTNIDVSLVEDIQALDEVVVVGYGTSRKVDLTGSLSSVSSEDLQDLNISSAEQALIGKMPGVQVKQVSGEPGTSPQILIRGINSIDKSTSPLIVVDGHPIGDINMINPNDIERMDVLKDASATAIYGSRGTNGVILITTKKGQAGRNTLDLNVYAGVQSVAKKVDMMNSTEIAQFLYDGFVNRNLDEGNDISGDPTTWRRSVDQIILDVLDGTNTTDTDWQDEIFSSSVMVQSYHLASRGGSENTTYYVSGEYYSQDGVIENSSFNRYSLRMSIESRINDRINIGGTFNPSYTTKNDVQTSGGSGGTSGAMLSNALIAQPFAPVFNEEGEYQNLFGFPGAVNNTNPVALANLLTDNEQRAKILGNIFADINLTDNLIFKASLGYSIVNARNKFFRPQNNAFNQGVPFGSSGASQNINWINTYTLNYTKTLAEKHNFNAFVGYDIQKDQFENNSLSSDNYPNNLVQTLNAASEIDEGSSFESEWTLLSYMGRINYNFDNRYYLTTSLRRDGSSRFGSDNKWGLFPSAAVAWRISNESFMQDLQNISNLKLRVSYGLTGNNNIGDYLYIPTVAYNNYVLGNELAAGYHPNRIANPLLQWEQQEEINFGLDLGLFDYRLNIVADYFIKKNEDLLLNVQIPTITGFSNTTSNIGTIQNKGFEFEVISHNIKGSFNWTSNFNISFYRNEVLELGPEGDDIISGGRHITRIGEPIGMFYGWVNEGVIMNQQELDEAPIYNPGGSSETRVGDFRWRDVNGDEIIDNDDRTIMGNPHPEFIYGMTNSFTYKGFDLQVILQGSYGNDILWTEMYRIANTRGRRNQLAMMNDYWKSEENPGNGKIPRPNNNPTGNNRGRWNSFYLQDGSFLRISNMTLGYNLPDRIVNKLALQKCRLYITASNPFTFTKYEGYNPDVNNSTSPLMPGEDANSYPVMRTLSFGINLSL